MPETRVDDMAFSSTAALVDYLRDSQLLEPAQVEEVVRELLPRSEDPSALCRQLVQCGWLTWYQADQLLAGNGPELILGPYRLLEPLGEGGMGQVFKAVQQRLHRVVALKVIRQDLLSKDEEVLRRFQREARTAAQLSHPNVVIVYDADQVGDRHFIAMEYVEGTDLSRLVKRHGPLPIVQACDFIRQAALGLQHAHESGMVHRDIKPSNLFATVLKPKSASGIYPLPALSAPPREAEKTLTGPSADPAPTPPEFTAGAVIKILDMGIARLAETEDRKESNHSLTREGVLMGTPDYIAPEQARNARAADIRSDLYSLGCTFYFLLTGQPPFPHGSMVEKLMLHQMEEPQPVEELRPDVPVEVRVVLRKLMAKGPEDRYQTPAELVEALTAPAAGGSAVQLRLPAADAEKETTPTASGEAAVLGRTPPVVDLPPAPEQRLDASVFGWLAAREGVPTLEAEPALRIALLKGHHGWVSALAFSPDRDTLASGGVDGAVRLWSFSSSRPGDQVLERARSGREVNSLAFAPDSLTIASGSGTLDGLISLWDLSAGKAVRKAVIPGHKASVEALAFAPDGKELVSAGADGTVRLWDLTGPQPREQAVLKGHTDSVKAVAFSPDGKTIVSAGQDGTAHLWNVAKRWPKEQATLRLCTGHARTLAFSPDSQFLALGSIDQTVRLWDLTEAEPAERVVLKGHLGVIRLVMSPLEGKTLLSIDDRGLVILWDVASGTTIRVWQLPKIMLCGITATLDGRYLATGNSDGSVGVFRLYPKKADSIHRGR
jgi:serine/threonine protein kinase